MSVPSTSAGLPIAQPYSISLKPKSSVKLHSLSLSPEKQCTVEFSDHSSRIYKIKHLTQNFTYFKNILTHGIEATTRKVTLQQIDFPMFKVAQALFLNRDSIFNVLSEESLQNPNVFENLKDLFDYLMPISCEDLPTALYDIETNQLPYMSHADALAIMDAYRLQMSQNPCSSSNVETTDLPVAVKIAKEVIRQVAMLTERKRTPLMQKIKENNDKIMFWNIRKKQLEKEGEAVLSGQFIRDLGEVTKELAQYEVIDRKLQSKLQSDTIINRQNLINYVEDPANKADPELQARALIARGKIERYQQRIIAALTTIRADLGRTDLLEYLIGPKAYLLKTYSMKVGTLRNKQYIFKHAEFDTARFTYMLDNDGPYDLEEEIRKDIHLMTKNELPKRRINERIITIPDLQTPEAIKLRSEVLFALSSMENWINCPKKVKNRIIQKIIDYNNLGKYGLTPYEINIRDINNKKITGTIKFSNGISRNHHHSEENFHILTANFKIIITSDRPRDSNIDNMQFTLTGDAKSTRRFLKLIDINSRGR